MACPTSGDRSVAGLSFETGWVLKQSSLSSDGHCLRAIVGTELVKNRVDVELHRPLGDRQIQGDLLGRQPVSDQPQHFTFPLAQRLRATPWRVQFGHYPRCNAGLQVRAAAVEGAHTAGDLLGA